MGNGGGVTPSRRFRNQILHFAFEKQSPPKLQENLAHAVVQQLVDAQDSIISTCKK